MDMSESKTASEIVAETVRAATPDAPAIIREVTRAVFDGRRRIRAEVVLFDGLPAKLRLERWAHGWGFGWDEMPGGSCSLRGGQWRRVQEDCAHCAGRGFRLNWDDHGGQMRAVPGDTCRYCEGDGLARSALSKCSPQGAADDVSSRGEQ